MMDLREEIIKCKTMERAMELINMVTIQNKELMKFLRYTNQQENEQ